MLYDLYMQMIDFLMYEVGFEASIFGAYLCEIIATVSTALVVFLPFFIVYKIVKILMEMEF